MLAALRTAFLSDRRVLAIDSRSQRLWSAFGIASGIAMFSFRLRFLTKGGAVAAAIVGGLVSAGTGFQGGITLVSYFLSSSLLGRLPRVSLSQRRGNQRDAVQVTANGAIPALLAAAHLSDATSQFPALSTAYSSAVAAAAADTWATEIGSRFGKRPRSILTGHHVQPGTSGGISAEGIVGACAGAALVALIASSDVARIRNGTPRYPDFLGITAGGFVGSIADSLLGATFQEVRYCERCSIATEQLVHDCGAQTSHARGIACWNNDVTNLLGIICGATIGVAATSLINVTIPGIAGSSSTT